MDVNFTKFSLPLIRNTGTRRPWWRRVLDWILRRKSYRVVKMFDVFEDFTIPPDPIVRVESYEDNCDVFDEDEKDDIIDYSESS